jgi:hypothetical protein
MYICFFLRPLLGAFAKRVDAVSFVMSVCPYVSPRATTRLLLGRFS